MTFKSLVVQIKKNIVSSICAGLSVLLLGVYLFRRGGVSEFQSLIEAKTSESGALKTNVLNSASLKDHLEKLKSANQRVTGRLVKGGDLAKNQQYFYKMEADSGVKLMDLRPAAASAAPKTPVKSEYSLVSYVCTVQGTYQQLLVFLGKLEGGEHFSRILSASVSLVSGGAESANSSDPALTLMLSIEFLGQS